MVNFLLAEQDFLLKPILSYLDEVRKMSESFDGKIDKLFNLLLSFTATEMRLRESNEMH